MFVTLTISTFNFPSPILNSIFLFKNYTYVNVIVSLTIQEYQFKKHFGILKEIWISQTIVGH